MIKTLISPIQHWLMAKGQCPGCGMPLKRGVSSKHKAGNSKVICKCGRIFIYETKLKRYRRALVEEI